MKREGDRIEIMNLNGDGGLNFYDGSIEDARKMIDDTNAQRIREGWIKEPKSYLIVCHEWYRYFDDKTGEFLRSQDLIGVCEKYPA